MKSYLDTSDILSMEELEDVYDSVEGFDEIITDEVYDNAVSYELIENVEDYSVTIFIYDKNDKQIASFIAGDYDEALEVLEDVFDIDEDELED